MNNKLLEEILEVKQLPSLPAVAVHAIGRAGAVMQAHWLQFPIRARDHVDSSIAIHQNRHVAIFRAGRTGRRKDLFRML